MPIVYQQDINLNSHFAIWKIHETEAFFLQEVQTQREIKHPKKRLQHLAGRYLLQQIMPQWPVRDLQILPNRRPVLQGIQGDFSISHCGDWVTVLASQTERCGVDVEAVTNRIDSIAHKFLATHEAALMLDIFPDWELQERLTLVWSIKEALFKWYGLGEVDFSEELLLQQVIRITALSGQANCQVIKAKGGAVQVNWMQFEQHMLAWICMGNPV